MEWVDSEQARLTQMGAALLGAMIRDDGEGVEILMEGFQAEARGPEAVLFVAILAANTWCLQTGRPLTAVADLWPSLPPPAPPFDELADRNGITALATATRAGTDAERAVAQARMVDRGVLLISGMDLAIAALNALAAVSSIAAADWCRLWA